jgi:transposase
MIALHKNARTTPAIRGENASSTASAASLAQRFGVSEVTVYEWKKRTSFQNCSHTAHRPPPASHSHTRTGARGR